MTVLSHKTKMYQCLKNMMMMRKNLKVFILGFVIFHLYYVVTIWCGFKIVGDNFEKNFHRTFQRLDYQTVSRHYFHLYAVKDRIDLSHLSDVPRDGTCIDIPQLLPLDNDHTEMKKNFSVLISRYISWFQSSCTCILYRRLAYM